MTMPQDRPTAKPEPSALARFFGGRPSSVIIKLILLSILVGFILRVLGLDPLNIIRSIRELFDYVWNMGFDAIITLGRYFILGAVLVIPIWLIIRLVRAPRGR